MGKKRGGKKKGNRKSTGGAEKGPGDGAMHPTSALAGIGGRGGGSGVRICPECDTEFNDGEGSVCGSANCKVRALILANTAAELRESVGSGVADAFLRPVMKIAPRRFDSSEAAEAAGWLFDPALGRWTASQDHNKALKRLETFASSLTAERVGEMTSPELENALYQLGSASEGAGPLPGGEPGTGAAGGGAAGGGAAGGGAAAGGRGKTSKDSIKDLRTNVSTEAAFVQRKCREMRKRSLADTTSIIQNSCNACGQSPRVGQKHQACGRCKTVVYCNSACQREHCRFYSL